MLKAQANFKSDPRVSCAIVAGSVLAQLESNEIQEAGRVYATTLVRLLDSYRVGGIAEEGSHGVLHYVPLLSGEDFYADDNTEQVHKAFQAAHHNVFPTLSDEDFVKNVSASIRHYIPANEQDIVDAQISLERLKKFLAELRGALRKETA
jgi:hypothetical protein